MQLNLLVLPEGLERTLTNALTLCAHQADPIDLTYLGNRVHAHLQRAHFAAQAALMVNMALAEAIAATYTHLLSH
ncbi:MULTISPECIES: hypothetical protein [Cyanophyceae]|uniref:hypothetical protein n=1 Tax=Cyanophyceae TaxID=3028117 RepID=UPI0016829437|nr:MULTISPECIES: hypothetical protein [Cyanophyceae]MBD1914581.1 hypothetical protein [Phormidium sp. FACHB-77]MBD2030305.1 hypothetical protein [Phormidium sp. FACHB-322]MBD2049851.1 hypothetical protein [Leptolyngbya sp. FACHB-60]